MSWVIVGDADSVFESLTNLNYQGYRVVIQGVRKVQYQETSPYVIEMWVELYPIHGYSILRVEHYLEVVQT